MSGVRGFMEVSGLTIAANTTETLIQLLAGTNHPITILGWSVGFNSVAAADEPIGCQLLIQTTAGTAAMGGELCTLYDGGNELASEKTAALRPQRHRIAPAGPGPEAYFFFGEGGL